MNVLYKKGGAGVEDFFLKIKFVDIKNFGENFSTKKSKFPSSSLYNI
jgi:hypothetical protein